MSGGFLIIETLDRNLASHRKSLHQDTDTKGKRGFQEADNWQGLEGR